MTYEEGSVVQVKCFLSKVTKKFNWPNMGFSTYLQSKAAHEALLSRQDAELRLLETMRRCITNKVKCDKDYALALTAIAGLGQKTERSEDLFGSLVGQAWKGMMEELDSAAKLIKLNAETVEKDTLEKVNTLCQEKRKARKQYLEEYTRITQHFSNVSYLILLHFYKFNQIVIHGQEVGLKCTYSLLLINNI